MSAPPFVPGDASVADIAAAFGVSPTQVDYAVRTRGIAHARRVGYVRLFDRRGQRAILRALREVAAKPYSRVELAPAGGAAR